MRRFFGFAWSPVSGWSFLVGVARIGALGIITRSRIVGGLRRLIDFILIALFLAHRLDGITQPLLGDVDDLVGVRGGKLRVTLAYAFFKRSQLLQGFGASIRSQS